MNIIKVYSKRASVVTTALLIVLLVVISGCVSEVSDTHQSEETSNDTETPTIFYQFIDPERHFNTNDINLAQQEIPFTIVLPSYVPECFGTDYLYDITGPWIDEYSDTVEVKIWYYKGDYEINISEQNRKIRIIPNEELEPIYYDISGTRVLRQLAQHFTGNGIKSGLRFHWNPDGLTFEVETFNISEEEGLKIVESMIIQPE